MLPNCADIGGRNILGGEMNSGGGCGEGDIGARVDEESSSELKDDAGCFAG
jgi:hypothetical protein